MPAYFIAVYGISFSLLRALSQQIRFVGDQVFLQIFLQLISDSADEMKMRWGINIILQKSFLFSLENKLLVYFLFNFFFFYIHTYIIGHHNTSVRIIDLVTHTFNFV